ncbi:MAG: zeta toxin family protein [Halothiobacillaceae bacterium]
MSESNQTALMAEVMSIMARGEAPWQASAQDDNRPRVNLEPIQIIDYSDPERMRVQKSVADAVQHNPAYFIDRYKDDPRAFGGRYVSADLFKETFDDFNASPESRNYFNSPVHNSAAVLSAALFRENLNNPLAPEQNNVIFLTGIPGAGKTTSILETGDLGSSVRMVFEGQLSNPKTSIEKIQQVLDAGMKPEIIVVHANPEVALVQTLQRFEGYGRGASIDTMAKIQGGLPEGLTQIKDTFGDAVTLNIYDVRDRNHPQRLSGWEHLPLLQSEGDYEHIKQRLTKQLDGLKNDGLVSEAGFSQASGQAPRRLERGEGIDGENVRGDEAIQRGRGISQANPKAPVLNPQGEFDQLVTGQNLVIEKAVDDGMSYVGTVAGEDGGTVIVKVGDHRAVAMSKARMEGDVEVGENSRFGYEKQYGHDERGRAIRDKNIELGGQRYAVIDMDDLVQQNRRSIMGKVLAVEPDAIYTQFGKAADGRDQVVAHHPAKLDAIPALGSFASINYGANGLGKLTAREQSKGLDQQIER